MVVLRDRHSVENYAHQFSHFFLFPGASFYATKCQCEPTLLLPQQQPNQNRTRRKVAKMVLVSGNHSRFCWAILLFASALKSKALNQVKTFPFFLDPKSSLSSCCSPYAFYRCMSTSCGSTLILNLTTITTHSGTPSRSSASSWPTSILV